MKTQREKFPLLALTLAALALNSSVMHQARAASWVASGNLHTNRWAHTATLLSTGKVLVAGGNDGTNVLSSAEHYDPTTGQWTMTGVLTTARWGHTATMLPNGKVLVAGGYSGGHLSSAEIYHPATGMWTATGKMITARLYHTATLLPNGKVLVVGGRSVNDYVSSAEIYDPVTETWTTTGAMTTVRSSHTATLLPNGKVLVAGGFYFTNHTSVWLDSAEEYDSATGTWTVTGSMTTGRVSHTATLMPNGKVLAVGGGGQTTHSNNILSSVEVYDPTNRTWTTTSALTTARWVHTATLLPNGKVLVVGGENGAGGAISSTALYDPASGLWTPTSILNGIREWHTATLLSNGKILVAGGSTDGNGSRILSSSELFDSANMAWANTGVLKIARWYHTATLLTNGAVLVAGGATGTTAELYDQAAGGWTFTGTMTTNRFFHTATLLPDGRVLVVGGQGSGAFNNMLTRAELYDPASQTWAVTGAMTTGRRDHTATLLRNGKVLVAGGFGTTFNILASAEIYDPATGTWAVTGTMTSGREQFTATLLPDGKVLAVGGQYQGIQSTAELYDPATGKWTRTGAMAAGRFVHSATLLPNGMVLVAGGDSTGVAVATAELFDAATGKWAPTGALHTARRMHIATLLGDGRVLVTGGETIQGGSNIDLASAEIYDPVTGQWTLTTGMSSPRDSHTATLLKNGKVLIAGGDRNGFPSANAGVYDAGLGFSNSWQPQISTVTSPLSLGGSLAITGSRFQGVSEASGGNSQNSPSDYPVVQLRNLESGQTTFLLATNWSANSFTSAPVFGLPPGWTMVTMFVNGIPSDSIITALIKGTATVTLGNLSQFYDGAAKHVSVTTLPPELTVNLTYNGSTNAPINVGSYTVIGTVNDPNYQGIATNTLVIRRATLSILVQPASQTVTEGENITFTVAAEGNPELQYQWRHGAVNIIGATNSSVMLSNVQYSDSGAYSVVVYNGYISTVSSNATLTVNRVPVANPKSISLTEDTPAIITLTGFDPDGNLLNYILVSVPTNGNLSGTPPNLNYKPNTNYFGPDSFTFKVNDGLVDSAPATVSITVLPVNDPPVAHSQIVATDEDIPLNFSLTGEDADDDKIYFEIVQQPAHGVLISGGRKCTYTPNPDYFGDDLFTFTVSDPSNAVSQLAAVSITVRSVNDAPVAKIVLTPLNELPGVTNLVALAPVCCDATLRLDASESTDVENDPLTYVWLEGTNVLSTDVIATNRFKPGTHEITLLVSDGTDVTAASVTVEIITPAEAVAFLNTLVEGGIPERRHRQPLVEWLREAGKKFEHCQVEEGVKLLELFKQRVQDRIAPVDAELATALIETATAIIEAAPDCDPCHRLGRHDHKRGKDRDRDERDGHDNSGQNERPEARPESPEVRAGQSSPKSR